MSIRLEKPWQALSRENVEQLGGHLGVYQIGDADGAVIRIDYAGGRSLFGLRGELLRQCEEREDSGAQFRLEVTQQYLSRYEELLMVHQADHGELPAENREDRPAKLGRLHPA